MDYSERVFRTAIFIEKTPELVPMGAGSFFVSARLGGWNFFGEVWVEVAGIIAKFADRN